MRACHFTDGMEVKERIVAWDEGKSLTIDIFEGSMPLNCAKARLDVKTVGPNKTEVSMTMGYEVKYGPLGKMMDLLMMKGQFTSMREKKLRARSGRSSR